MKLPLTAIVLFAHGSRDPLWRAPIDAVAAEIQRQAPDMVVQCAFLELMAPSLPEAVQALVEAGHRSVRVVPLFLGMGRHAREDLPELVAELRQSHPDLHLQLLPAAGEMPELTRCLAAISLDRRA
jgi:sirohydrochlorin cobaltochelatase